MKREFINALAIALMAAVMWMEHRWESHRHSDFPLFPVAMLVVVIICLGAVMTFANNRNSNPKRRAIRVIAIALLLAAVWTEHEWELYARHHRSVSPIIPMAFLIAFIIGWSGFVGYSLVKRRTYLKSGEWIYRDQEPWIYWFYVAFYMLLDGAIIFGFVAIFCK